MLQRNGARIEEVDKAKLMRLLDGLFSSVATSEDTYSCWENAVGCALVAVDVCLAHRLWTDDGRGLVAQVRLELVGAVMPALEFATRAALVDATRCEAYEKERSWKGPVRATFILCPKPTP